MARILVVDDEQPITEFITYNLNNKGYDTMVAHDGDEALRIAKKWIPDLILLDIMMPGKDGRETLEVIRTLPELQDTMVIFLTALSDEKNEIDGLELGADDYIGKPIKMDLLLTRVNAAIRRHKKEAEQEEKYVFGDLEINKTKFTVSYRGEEFILAKKEFELLQLLASKPGRVFLRNEILQRVWGTEVIVGERTIDVHVRKIRQKLNLDLIRTVKGVGYKFEMV